MKRRKATRRAGCTAAAWLVATAFACGPPPSREQRTVYAAASQSAPAPVARRDVEPATPEPALDPVTAERWVQPIEARDATSWAMAFTDDATLEVAGDSRMRQGRAQLAGWLQGHVLAWPYAEVRSVHAGASARPGTEVRVLELLDACHAPLLRLTAKLTTAGTRYTHAWVQLDRVDASTCSP